MVKFKYGAFWGCQNHKNLMQCVCVYCFLIVFAICTSAIVYLFLDCFPNLLFLFIMLELILIATLHFKWSIAVSTFLDFHESFCLVIWLIAVFVALLNYIPGSSLAPGIQFCPFVSRALFNF